MLGFDPHFSVTALLNFMVLVSVALLFYRGTRAMRLVAWIGMWQFLTPNREMLPDLMLMTFGWFVHEVMFLAVVRKKA